MHRPTLLSFLPRRLRSSVYSRFYSHRHQQFAGLFDRATLEFAPDCVLRDLLPGDVISGHIAFTGYYESTLSELIVDQARSGGLFVDVGANIGYYSVLWAAASPLNSVVAFEASPRIIPMIEGNISGNGLEARIRLIPKAASDRRGLMYFDKGPKDQTGWGGLSSAPTELEVPVVRIDEELSDQTISVMKIDVEGAEFLGLKGCEALLRAKRIGCIYFESNPERAEGLGNKNDAVLDFLASVDYRSEPIDKFGKDWIAFPK